MSNRGKSAEDPNSFPPAIIVFLRTPEQGKVKTRLAKSLGDLEALRIYRHLISRTLMTVSDCHLPTYLYFHPRIDHAIQESFSTFNHHVQEEGDLGWKMYKAFEDILSRHPRAILIGTDCPYLTPALLAAALTSLEHHDLVIGPAKDGGYYLIGLNKNEIKLFEDISWSTETVFRDTLTIIQGQHLSCHILPELSDIDQIEDWNEYQTRNSQ